MPEKGVEVHMQDKTFTVFDASGEIMLGQKADGMYKVSVFIRQVACSSSANLWHARLGHVSVTVMKQMQAKGMLPKEACTGFQCEACILGKQHRVPAPTSLSRADEPLDLRHSDVCGPFPVATPYGHLYMLTVLWTTTASMPLCFLRSKSDVASRRNCAMSSIWERQLGRPGMERRVKRLRSDEGGEYAAGQLKGFLREKGILQVDPWHEIGTR
jgi:hypothetical protein